MTTVTIGVNIPDPEQEAAFREAFGISAANTPADDGASGADFTDVQGFIDRVISPDGASTTKTVGAGGDFATLVLALDWARAQPLTRPLYLNLLEKNTPDTDSGSMAIPSTGYIFDNPNSINLHIVGPAFGGGQGVPANADMTGVKATDLAYIKTRFNASIRLNGNDDLTGGYGLAFPNGLGSLTRILVESRTRYSLDFGFNGAHSSSRGRSSGMLDSCAVFGGVWGAIGEDAHLNLRLSNWFGYQISGGPFAMFGGLVESDSSNVRFYCPPGNTANNPKYAAFCFGAKLHMNEGGSAGKIEAKGPFLHGLYAVGGSSGDFIAASFDGVTMPFSIGEAVIDISGFSITNADPANTSLVPGTTQPGIPGNEGSGSLINVGPGGELLAGAGAISDSVASRYVFCNGGRLLSYSTCNISGSKANVNAFVWAASKGNIFSAAITSPQGGSVDQSVAQQNGDVFWVGSTASFAKSPALNTPTNGSGNYA